MTEGTGSGMIGERDARVKRRGERPNSRLVLGMAVGLFVGVLATLLVVFLDTDLLSRPRNVQTVAVPITGTPLAAAPSGGGQPEGDRRFIGMVDVRSGVFGRHREYLVYAGCLEDMSYGHFITVDFGLMESPVITEAVAEQNGIRVRFDSGHELLVPSKLLGCGR
ncbi:hypothetical protein OHB26_13610 [Nocardia sp. NBC_01503]|uniref:hypothetical protein n=1 Tax=Nocardia sp. NBC_01503 TaxID=2975997 RepID=UPI002E7BDDB0|nr:hypothetical protein [Nocardia sp. NBC_01503]WTL35133.1 hypothetical protein OHB26_13610 [Nocardia sp. NBC_01503]